MATADVLLSDGTAVQVRPIEPSDAEAIVALHARFSDRTRYMRYFSPYPRIPERDLKRFVNVDHHDREALVVALGADLVAVGRYERLGPGADDAEVAFVVEDAHQGRGIGSILLEHLASRALEVGIGTFVAEVLPANHTMLRVFADAGFTVHRQYADGVVHLRLPIAPTAASLEVQWRREHTSEARSIARLLSPRGVAVYGVSRDGSGLGAAVLAHLRDGGYPGPIVPIHPSAEEIDGLAAHRRLADAGVVVDLAMVAVPAEALPEVLADAAAAKVHGLVVYTAGFAETGAAGEAAQQDLVAAAYQHGLRVVGPNCLGIANTDPAVRLNATLAATLPRAGRVGFFSQSGALGVALLAAADRRGLGLSTFVSAGNRADVSGNDLLQYWQDDPGTDVILLYLETFGNPRKFARLTRRIGRTKPIVVLAPWITTEPTEVGGGVPAVQARPGPDWYGVSALFASAGVIRVGTIGELFDVGLLLARQPLPAGDRVAVVTNSPALGRLAANAGAAAGLSVGVVDVGPAAAAAVFTAALRRVAGDPDIDAVIAVAAPPLPGLPGASYTAGIDRVAAAADKPVLAVRLGVGRSGSAPTYPAVEEAVHALARVARYADWRRQPHPSPPIADEEPPSVGTDAAVLLAHYGLTPTPVRSARAGDGAAAEAAADAFGYPVAVKVADQLHRPDLSAIRLGLGGPAEVRRAAAELADRFGADTQLLVQPMVGPGLPCVLEAVQDPAFGPVVGFGLGGPVAELVGDRAWRPAPLDDADAAALIREPRSAPLLAGGRRTEAVDRDALARLAIRVGRLIDEQPQVASLTINPILARPDGYTILHAEVSFAEPAPRPDSGPRQR
jgi:acyl-CoA synthetase (NDP forming)/RimJ/RimL family protein N-acetyltransferase